MTTEAIITADDNPHALLVRAPDERQAILLMDRSDLEQAMAELSGSVVDQFVYVAKGKKQLTYAGIKEAARLYRNVHFGATATPLPDGSWMITSYAHNLADNTRVDYPLPYPPFDPADKEASLEFRATLSKSIRNALAAVLPIAYLNTMIARWMEQKSGGAGRERTQEPSASQPAPRPARDTPARAAAERRSGDDAPEHGSSAADWTPQQLAARIREMAGTSLQTLVQWQNMARTYGVPVPARGPDMTQEWLLGLYQAMNARSWEERIRLAASEQDVTDARAHALSERDKRGINAEQHTRLYDVAEARYAELAGPLTAHAL